jgi:cytoskeletal protein CcmA (bactofilin family)
MFTRNSPAVPKQSTSVARGANGAFSAAGPETNEKSVIGNDLKIIGQGLKIVGRGVLQVDGEIEGDVQAAEVIVGEKGQVTGMVAGRQVVVRGRSPASCAEGPWRCRPHRKSMATSTTCRC